MGMDEVAFRNPSPEYRTAPFWSWNGKLTLEETRRQVREMVEKGMGGGFLHSRAGLATEYLGKEWFENCAAVVEEGRRVGFLAYLYDEDRWPSGSCGGRTAEVNPDFRARTLVMEHRHKLHFVPHVSVPCEPPDRQERRPLACFRLATDAEGKTSYEVLPEGTASCSGSDDVVTFYEWILPRDGWENGGWYPDLMHDGAVREFIRNTHEEYAKRFAGEFGRQVPGIFTDEPLLKNPLPWSVRMRSEFQRRRGYDLVTRLPALVFPTDDAPAVRHDYWKTVHELFDESYFQQIGRWCEEHNIALTGHAMMEGDIVWQILYNGSVMPHYLPMQLPGIDILLERITEVLTCKQASSVCNQFGKRRLLSETYGCTGYNFSFEGQKWIGDWQMALGVNLICQHLTLYTMRAGAKRDYPPSYFEQSPWWRHFRQIADYQARLSYALSQGSPVRDILLLHPVTSAWCEFSPLAGERRPSSLSRESDDTFILNRIMDALLGLHRDFDLGDETILAAHGRVEGDELVVGSARYRVLVVPPVRNLESTTVALIERFIEAGGRVVWLFGQPEMSEGKIQRRWPVWVDGRPDEAARRLACDPRVRRGGIGRRELAEMLDSLLPRRVSVVRADTADEAERVLCQERHDGNARIYFLANTDRTGGVRVRLCVPATGRWELWDCTTGDVHPMPSRRTGDGSEVEIELAPAGSALLRLDPSRRPAAIPRAKPAISREVSIAPRGGWRFRRLAPNSLVLDRCRYRLNAEPWSDEDFLVEAQEKWRKRLGFFPVLTMNVDVQPWKRLQDPSSTKPVAQLALQYRFHVSEMPVGEVNLVLEDRALCRIRVNGTPLDSPATGWFMDRSFETVPIRNLLRNGENTIEIDTDLSPMRVMEDIYIVGDFGVDSGTHSLIPEPSRLLAGDWCRQGYPFYTDGMLYIAPLTVPRGYRGRVIVAIERFEGTVAAVWANGQKAGVLGWRPYEVDVTDFVKPGRNELGIEVVGSPRNLMGPRHSGEKYPPGVGSPNITDTTEPGYHLSPAGLYGTVTVRFTSR